MEDCLCVAQDEVLRALRGIASKGGRWRERGIYEGVWGGVTVYRRGSIATSDSLKESGINRQFQQRAGRKCKFPARRKDEKRIRARTPRVYWVSHRPFHPHGEPPLLLNFMCQLYAIVFTLLPARFSDNVAGRRVFPSCARFFRSMCFASRIFPAKRKQNVMSLLRV